MQKINIAIGTSRHDVNWKNRKVDWLTVREKLTTPQRTHETAAAYAQMSKDRRAEIKDVGGFVAGQLKDGRRKACNVVSRSAITLDLDYAPIDFWDIFTLVYPDVEACLYSTHSHTVETPRYRLIMPLDRDANPDEYEAVSRYMAGQLGIDSFDDSTFEPERLMYYPSTSKDGEWVGVFQEGEWLSVDATLAMYADWTDRSYWPISSRVEKVKQRNMVKQGNPTEKRGVVGAFCREFGIRETIEEFLSDVYVPTTHDNRYTYTGGTSGGGLVIYDDLYAYSHHATDPCFGKTSNAFDLVRIHMFGDLDEKVADTVNIGKRPSFQAMATLASENTRVKQRMFDDGFDARRDFETPCTVDGAEVNSGHTTATDDDDTSWVLKLGTNKDGILEQTIANVELILSNDKALKGVFAFNEFENREVALRDLAWRKVIPSTMALTDADDSQLRGYLERKPYRITGRNVIQDGMSNVVHNNKYHPVKEYLSTLEWDGVERIGSLLSDYLGAEMNEYTYTVMRKVMTAAVSRIYNAGCKFDYMLTLVGAQGKGKSTIAKKLGRQWYSDSFGTIQGKEAFESIQGVWIMEMGELAALRKAEIEPIKHFISKQTDRYRVAYGRRVEDFPRQCIFIGTTNDKSFLKDPTGNRRFWVVDVGVNTPTKSIWDIPDSEVDQMWAEAIELYKNGETLYLNREIEEMAKVIQEEHTERNENTSTVEEFLDLPILPEAEWDELESYDKRNILFDTKSGTVTRLTVTLMEIWTELFNNRPIDLDDRQGRVIKGIMSKIDGWEYGKFYKNKKQFRGYTRIV